jgi:hypothetical protein
MSHISIHNTACLQETAETNQLKNKTFDYVKAGLKSVRWEVEMEGSFCAEVLSLFEARGFNMLIGWFSAIMDYPHRFLD